jgi:leukotriene-A4 hydrolase
VDAGAYEFANTEKFIAAGEAICGPYPWGIYDVLLMPPSFPYGGMENPCQWPPLPPLTTPGNTSRAWCISLIARVHVLTCCCVASCGSCVCCVSGLTFVTPTLLAGDRSLANVVAHEIAHSWFGSYQSGHMCTLLSDGVCTPVCLQTASVLTVSALPAVFVSRCCSRQLRDV